MTSPYLMDLRLMKRRVKTIREMKPVDYWNGWWLSLANEAAVSSWVDRMRATDLVQATADDQPTFATADHSLTFDGVSDFLGHTGSEVCGSGDFTLVVRFKCPAAPGAGTVFYLFGEGNSAGDNPIAALSVDENGKPRLTIRTAAGGITVANGSTGSDLCDDTYHSLAGRYVQSTGAMQLNVAGVTTTYTGTRAWAATTFNTTRVGCHGRTSNVSFLAGSITHCVRFNRAISDTELSRLFAKLV